MTESAILKPSKFDHSCLLCRIFNFWVFDFVLKGYRGELKLSDLGQCPKHDVSKLLADRLEKQWTRELEKKNPSLGWATTRSVGLAIVPITLFTVLNESLIGLVQPLFLANLIHFFTNPQAYDYSYAWLSAAAVIGISWTFPIIHHPVCFYAMDVAIQARVSWVTLIYRKALRLNVTAFSKTTVGQILNLMSNDVSRFDDFTFMFPYLITGPILTVLGTYICYIYVGNVAFIGLGVMMILIPINYFAGKFVQQYQNKITALTDKRVNLMNEIIKFMRTIKMYAWEKHFSELISQARKKEMEKISISVNYWVVYLSIALMSPRIILFTMFVSYVLLDNTLTADKVFVVMAVINTVTFSMTNFVPDCIAYFYQLSVSARRIQRYLSLEEIGESTLPKSHYQRLDILTKQPVVLNDVCTKWDSSQTRLALDGITLEIKQGELLAVIGTVGSGKSTFLMTLMNEPSIVSGSVEINGQIAYASQEPWCFNDSIEQNILFGKPLDKKRFDEVIEVCALRKDLSMLPHAEKTLVGERGVILSGGQKARITLARALYSDADIYLLDDPLSAVDAEVANHIFDRCIGEYLREKTVVLVTHQVQFIKKSSKVLVLEKGQPLVYGTYNHVLSSSIDLIDFIQKMAQSEKSTDQENPNELQRQTSQAVSEKSGVETEDECVPCIDEESMESGKIHAKLYLKYFCAGKAPFLLIVVVVFMLATQILYHLTDIWLTKWINENNANQKVDEVHYLIIYSSLVGAHLVASFIRNYSYFRMCILSSINMHNSIFYRLMRVPIYFFDTNPTGRILNRFTKDLGLVDTSIPHVSFEVFVILLDVLGASIVVCLARWYLIFPAIVLFAATLGLRVLYIRAARDLKRFEGIVRSPLYSHTTLTLSGLPTIRAFKAQPNFVTQYYQIQDKHTNVYFTSWAVSRFMGNILDWLCQIYIMFVVIFLVTFYEGIEGGTLGLALTMVFSLTGMTQWGIRQSTEFETQMTSVERINEYSKLEPEASLQSEYRFPENWPARGQIEFAHVTLTYQGNTTPVLKNLTFTVQGGEKVSIVGRTGAGKSSMLAALFRMVEVEGRVEIDGVDCRSIGLHELRSKMSIIPQEPMAFVGTLRKNLDPFDEHTDQEVWEALDKVQLRSAVTEMPGQLSYLLSEGGGNLSLGQRQLICLARALLRKNQILILDEATANVDHQTDELIQRTIRSCFAQCTVITIAHRLNTIIDSDRILVLDAGRVVQFDTPRNLLQDRSGIFFNLVQQTGPEMAAKLIQIANSQPFDES